MSLSGDEPWAVMGRIDVRANDIVIRLKRADALAAWRSDVRDAHSPTDRQILSGRRELLQRDETLSDSGEHLILSLSVRARFRGGAATVLDKECRIIAFAPALAFNGALLVARVLGLRNTSDMRPFEENPAPPESQQHADADRHESPGSVGPRENAQRFIDADQQIWHVLDLAAVAHDPHYLQVAA